MTMTATMTTTNRRAHRSDGIGSERATCAIAQPGFSYVAVWPNRAYGAMDPACAPRPSVRRGAPRRPSQAASAEALAAPTVVAASVAIIAAVALLAFALYFGAVAPSASATQRSHGVPGAEYETSTPIADWQQGTYPHLYQNNEAWGYTPFGGSTVAEAGSAPTSLCMAYVGLTGSHGYTPSGFASFGTERGLGGASTEEALAYLTAAADGFGLTATSIDLAPLALRQALAQGSCVIAIVPDRGASSASTCMLVTGVDEDSRLSVLNPASAEHVPEAWGFDELLPSASALVAISA